jgi:hypothetical protein
MQNSIASKLWSWLNWYDIHIPSDDMTIWNNWIDHYMLAWTHSDWEVDKVILSKMKDITIVTWFFLAKDVDSLEIVTTTRESQSVYCEKIKKVSNYRSEILIYELVPECLTTCEKLQQVITKWWNNLSKDDLEKISPACAESFE